ncbi:hypothetical protein B296_00024158 [Ensete ventricosum]|uniref:Uncharacterized protein n=1 Tax=Ensete ventricosum TaxID=4639 RepID=A0A426YSJ7_ENSVE|nr:hypothetical protein B296_00024158 [Ensete ventricosum]
MREPHFLAHPTVLVCLAASISVQYIILREIAVWDLRSNRTRIVKHVTRSPKKAEWDRLDVCHFIRYVCRVNVSNKCICGRGPWPIATTTSASCVWSLARNTGAAAVGPACGDLTVRTVSANDRLLRTSPVTDHRRENPTEDASVRDRA